MSAALVVIVGGCLLVLAWLLGGPLLAARRRAALAKRALSTDERRLLALAWPGYARVPDTLVRRLDALTAVFAGEKEFVGCGGLEVTTAMRLAIAAQACVLVLGRGGPPYPELRAVLVYPSPFVVPDRWHDEHGVVTEEQVVLSGQAWDVSRILLAWDSIEDAGRGSGAINVVIHEFAHYLDAEAGGSGGTPWLDSAKARRDWADVLGSEFTRLRVAVARGERHFLDEYGAHDEAEFFAVASEAFFEQPREFASRLPSLYGALRGFYRLDPAAWPGS